jgi:hypothetical protein
MQMEEISQNKVFTAIIKAIRKMMEVKNTT